MKRALIIISLLFFSAPPAFAHGGYANIIGDVVVYLNYSPLSPYVGQNVDMVYTIKTKEGQTLANFPFSFYLIDSYYGDQTKDKIILKKDLLTDVNGDYEFDYTFPKEAYFDTEIAVQDPITHQEETTGFLIYPRDAVSKKVAWYIGAGALVVGLAAGISVGLLAKKKK